MDNNIKLPADVQSDALQHTPSFDQMVGLIEKLFKDYLTDVRKNALTAEQIEKAWVRYKTLNHLWQDEQQHPRIGWVKATIQLPMHKAFWLIEEGFKKDCTFPVRIDGKIYGMGEIFSDADDGKSKFYFVIKGHSKDYYEDQFHRIEWLYESASPAAGREEDAVEFAEWIRNEGWEGRTHIGWINHNHAPDDLGNRHFYTTTQLYQLFKQQKEKK